MHKLLHPGPKCVGFCCKKKTGVKSVVTKTGWWFQLFPSLPKSSKYLVNRCLELLNVFSGAVWGSKHLLTRYLEDWGLFNSHPYLGKMNPFWRIFFVKGLKPPTRKEVLQKQYPYHPNIFPRKLRATPRYRTPGFGNPPRQRQLWKESRLIACWYIYLH